MIRQDWSKEIHDFYKQARELISVFGIFVIGNKNFPDNFHSRFG